MSRVGSYFMLFLLLIGVVVGTGTTLGYDVHWLSGPTTIERGVPSANKAVDIYCYRGSDKNLLALWQTVKFHVKTNATEFRQYIGESPQHVFEQYTEDSYGWAAVIPFGRRAARSVSVDLFAPTCMALSLDQKHAVELQVQRVDLWRVVLMVGGAALVWAARALSGNPVFFYLCGVTVGVSASFMVVVYYFSKLLPRKTLTYGVLIGGWTVGVYVVQRAWDNVRALLAAHRALVAGYAALAAAASLALCYRAGPPRDQRSRNLVMWTLQAVGVLSIFFSSQYQEASAAVAIMALVARYFPKSLLYRIQGIWRRRFPPKPRLLTDEQYYEQGARETRRALDELRRHCASPDCAQWRIVLNLSDAKRFAGFVEGDSHLSDDEILDYESYAFSLRRRKRRSPSAPSATPPPGPPAPTAGLPALDISDDDDDSSDDS